MIKIKYIFYSLIINLIIFNFSYAENNEAIDLDTVVVTATKSSSNKKDLPVNVQVITRDEISKSNAVNAGDLISEKTTGHFHRYAGISDTPGIRGFRSESHGDDIKGHVLILLDGHRVGTGNLAKIPADIIERIEVMKGPASAIYGSAAMGGVINIITKKGTKELKNSITAEYGSFDYNKYSGSSSATVSDKFKYFANLSYEKQDDYETKDYGKVYNSNWKSINAFTNMTFFPADNQDIRIGLLYSKLEDHTPSWNNYVNYSSFDDSKEDYSDKSHSNSDIEYNLFLANDKIHWKALGYYLWDKNLWYWGDTSTGGDVEDSLTRYVDTTIGTDQQLEISLLSNNKFLIGYTYEMLEKKSDQYTSNIGTIPATPGLEYKTNSVYLQDSLSLLDNKINIVVGTRWDHFSLKTVKPETGTYSNFVEKDKTYYHFSPRGGVSFKVTDSIKLRANAGQAFKTPSADEFSSEYVFDDWSGTQRILGNPDLDPEVSTTYEGGIDLYFKYLTMESTYSFTKTKNLIVDSDETVTYNGEEWRTYENLGKTEFQSIDSSILIPVGKFIKDYFEIPVDINLKSNLTYNLKYEDLDSNEKLEYVSNFEAKNSLDITYNKTSFILSHVYVGKQMVDNWDDYMNPTVEEKKAFQFFDAVISSVILNNFILKFSVNNITNKNYEWVRTYPMAERNYKISLTGEY